MRIIPSKPNMGFSKVPHSITFSKLLTPHQKMVWIMLDATCYNRETEAGSAAVLAEKLGLSARGLQRTIQELITMGFITKDGRLYSLEVEPSEEAESTGAVKERRLTRDEKLRLELKEIWNRYKPKNAPSMNDFTPARLKTLRVYAERFDADEQVVLRKVCDGSNADEFRRDKNWDFVNIFGDGIPTENKQSKVEKVYKLGCSDKGQAASFDASIDQDWIDWFHSKGHDSFIEVSRMTVSDRFEGWDHEVADPSKVSIRVYCDSTGKVVHWTYKQIPSNFVTQLPTS